MIFVFPVSALCSEMMAMGDLLLRFGVGKDIFWL